ncbi:MAG: sulfatase [Pirellulaceae bacterium]
MQNPAMRWHALPIGVVYLFASHGLIASIALLWVLMTQRVVGADRPPNVIIVFCDNLGYGDIEPFGSQLHRTPNLNRMAAEGRKFTHFCVTAGVCTPSRASLMTGCYAQRVGMHDNPRDGQVLRPVSPYGLHPSEVTIAEVLRARGYATSMIGKWHLGDQAEFLPTRQGFDSFFGIPYSDDMTAAVGQRVNLADDAEWPELPLMEDETVIEAPVDRHGLTKRYTQRALQFIEAHRDEPFFLYLPQAMPGSTAQPFASADFQGKSANGPWGDSIEELDWSQGQILDKLVELKIDDQTLVIWTSDNGAPNLPNSPARGSNAPLHGRGYTTGEGAFRVPMIAWWPGKIPANSVCESLATTMDLLPTCASLAGDLTNENTTVAFETNGTIDGHDIRSLLLGDEGAQSPYDALYYYERDQLQAVRRGPWKLFVPLSDFTNHPHFARGQGTSPLLFNLLADVGSQHNVAGDNPKIVAELSALADQARQQLGDRGRPGSQQRPRGHCQHPIAQVP